MANKTRRNRVRRTTESAPGTRAEKAEAARVQENLKNRKKRIEDHKQRALEYIHIALDEIDTGEFKQAGEALHAAAQFANLANAEVVKR